MTELPCDLGIIGLTSVGQCVAAHFAQSDQRVCVGDDDQSFVPEVVRAYQQQTEQQDGRKDDGLPSSKCMVHPGIFPMSSYASSVHGKSSCLEPSPTTPNFSRFGIKLPPSSKRETRC